MKPEKSPSLSDNDAEFQKLANEIWANKNITSFDKISIQPDVIISNAKNKILFRHRQTVNQEIYWLNNRGADVTEAEVSFDVIGIVPELWNAQTGKTEKVSYQIKDGRTIIPLKFESWDAFFIVFNEKTIVNNYTNPTKKENVLAQIATPWKVAFNDKNVTFNKLSSWSESTDNDVKYFSGTATYDNTFKVSSLDKLAKYIIDLGDVKNIAEVIVNGKNVGTAWKKPFKLDISEAVKVGENIIQVKVTNLWVNRLIGDAQPDAKTKTTFTTMPFYRGQEPLLPSGLIGEVKISEIK
jgi:hypothetical protein